MFCKYQNCRISYKNSACVFFNSLHFTLSCFLFFSSFLMTSTFVKNPDQLCYRMSPNLWVFSCALTISFRLKVLDIYYYKGTCFPFHLLLGQLRPLGPFTGGVKLVSLLRHYLPSLYHFSWHLRKYPLLQQTFTQGFCYPLMVLIRTKYCRGGCNMEMFGK